MVDTRRTRYAPEQDISGSYGGPRADSRVTHYFVALRSHARPRFLGDTVPLSTPERRETEVERETERVGTQHIARLTQNGSDGIERARAGISKRQVLPAPPDFGSLPYNNFNNPGPQLRRD